MFENWFITIDFKWYYYPCPHIWHGLEVVDPTTILKKKKRKKELVFSQIYMNKTVDMKPIGWRNKSRDTYIIMFNKD